MVLQFLNNLQLAIRIPGLKPEGIAKSLLGYANSFHHTSKTYSIVFKMLIINPVHP